MWSRVLAWAVFVLSTAIAPSAAWAQGASAGSISGTAKDTTGALLPGVNVEVSSPALIEKVRSAVTDGQGQYNIIELRPGRYSVTFTLPGFSTVRREGIELTAGFTAVINAEMRVGAVEETVTVTGASPVVDTQSVRTQNVLSYEVLDRLPTAKNVPGFAALTLGAQATGVGGAIQDVGGSMGEGAAAFAVHGGRSGDQKLKYDGMNMNTWHSSGGGTSRNMWLNQVGIQEMVLETSGVSAESETAGVQINAVPRDGGNRFRVYFLGNFANDAMQSDNLDDNLRAQGVTTVPNVKKLYDTGIGVGGPLKRDRLWFYVANRWWGTNTIQANSYYNATPDTPFYTRDLSRPAIAETPGKDYGLRITWQVSEKHKLALSDNAQRGCFCPGQNLPARPPSSFPDYWYGGGDGSGSISSLRQSGRTSRPIGCLSTRILIRVSSTRQIYRGRAITSGSTSPTRRRAFPTTRPPAACSAGTTRSIPLAARCPITARV